MKNTQIKKGTCQLVLAVNYADGSRFELDGIAKERAVVSATETLVKNLIDGKVETSKDNTQYHSSPRTR